MTMKKNILLALMLLLSLGMSNVLEAQTGKKKKKKKADVTNTAAVDSAAIKAAAEAAAKAAAATKPADTDGLPDTSHTDGLVADTSLLAYIDFPLDSTRPVDGMYKIPLLRGAKPFAFPRQDRNNIKFYKRLWRTIDLTDSVNKMFAVPGETLIAIIMESIKKGKLIAYKDEKFTSRLTYSQVMKQFADSETVSTYDDNGQEIGTKTIFKDFNPDSVTKFELKEDIYFDKTRGRLITQMIGLAPIKKLKTSSGEYITDLHPFWLYFPQCRVPFASREIYDTQRDIYNISYDDIFIQRQFKTRIVKESNPSEMTIKDKFPNDEAKQIAESDRIEREIEAFKKSIWKY